MYSDEYPELPKDLTQSFEIKLKNIIMNAKNAGRLCDEGEVKKIRQCFFDLFIELLKHYY